MAAVLRGTKNVLKGYTAAQVKVRNATSNDPWGPSGTEMSEIAQMTYHHVDFQDVMQMLDKRLNDKGKNWRHILKALKVLDYCLHEGSEAVVDWAKKNVFIVSTLKDFQYVDEEGRDQGLSIRVAARELTKLINDDELLRSERRDRRNWKSRVNGTDDRSQAEYQRHHLGRARSPRPRRDVADEEDEEYRKAIEASKALAEEERRKAASRSAEEADLERAIKLSKEEEERRQKQLEQQQSSADLLFDEAFSTPQPQQQQQQQQQPMYFQQNYQQGTGVDFFGNPLNTGYQQPQPTGYLDNVYAQQTGFPQQYQATGYEQQQQFLQPQSPAFLQPQQTAFNMNNPYALQSPVTMQPTGYLPSGANNPYANGGLQVQPEPLKPTPTGSNNPFAQFNKPSSPVRTGAPSLSMLSEQRMQTPVQRPHTAVQTQSSPLFNSNNNASQKPMDPHQARLNALLAAGNDGLDTYGNTGDLRIPAQHTAPGNFVNSAGTGRRPVAPQATGSNPFFNSQSFVPQQTGFGNSLAPNGRLVPAHTGPANMGGMNGFGGQQTNPYAPQQQSQQGSLIDL